MRRSFCLLSCTALFVIPLIAGPVHAVGDRGLVVAQTMPMPQGNGVAPNGKNEAGSDAMDTYDTSASATTSGGTRGYGNNSSVNNSSNGTNANVGSGVNAQGSRPGTGLGAGANAGAGATGSTP